MTRKISFGITLILLVIAIVLSSFFTVFFVLKSYDNLLVDLPQRAEQYLKLGELDELIRTEYFGSVDSDLIDDSLASGYINGLDDPFSFYVPQEDIEGYKNLLSGKMEGIGINAYFDNNSSSLIISYIYSGSPAHKNGIGVNDKIVSVNGKTVDSENFSELITAVTATSDKKVSLVIIKAVDGKEYTVELTSGYEIESCVYSVDKSVGYIRLMSYYEHTFDAFMEAVEYFKSENIKNIIIDLRNSSGQNFDVAAKIIDSIVPVGSEGTGAIFTAKNSSGETIAQYPSDSNALNMNFAVLINTRTEGAAELVAADIKDFGKGILVGETTSGHGTMQKLFSLSDGGSVYLTVAEIHPYISSAFNNKGIIPDIIVETSESFKNQLGSNDFSEDEQYKTAMSYFQVNS